MPSHAHHRRGSTTTVVVSLTSLVTLTGLAVTGWWLSQNEGESEGGPVLVSVTREKFLRDVVEDGEIESSENVEIRCKVKGRNGAGTAILEVLVNEGDRVEEGQELIRLDSSGFEQQARLEQIVLNNKKAAMIQAKNLWEAADLAKKEYLEGTFKQEEQTYQSEVFVAEENLRRAQEYARYSERLAAKGYVTALQLESDLFAVEKARKDLDAAQTKLHVLRTYTKDKTLRKLESDIRSAEAAFNAEKSSYEVQQKEMEELQQQIDGCKLTVPFDDDDSILSTYEVVFANDYDRRGNSEFVVEPGTIVRERQTLIRLPASGRMRVKAKIAESKISFVRVGMPATITIDAFDGLTMTGRIEKVSKYPEPSSWYSSSVKQYTAYIEINSPPEQLKPGLTSKVRIHTERVKDALQVPVQAIHPHEGRYYCLVRDGEGWTPKAVEVGSSNETKVVILNGLDEGEQVAQNPGKFIESVKLPSLGKLPKSSDSELLADQAESTKSVTVAKPQLTDGQDGRERKRQRGTTDGARGASQ